VSAKQEHRKILGETIRSIRRGEGISQEALAEMADLHHNFIGEIERGEKAASIDTLVKIAEALGVSVSKLVDEI
jgi:transcriptional regulator with XRE-family HTH domain